MKVTQSGNGYFTDDAEYVVTSISGSEAVKRGDGSFTIIADEEDAHEIAEALAAGEMSDGDREWQDQ